MLQTGIALAVAAVPEALPAVATIALAVGMRRMAARHALVRRSRLLNPGVDDGDLHRQDADADLREMAVVRVLAGGRRVEFRPTPGGSRCNDDAVIHFDAGGRPGERRSRRLMTAWRHSAAIRGYRDSDAAGRLDIERSRLVERCPFRGLVPFSSERKLMAGGVWRVDLWMPRIAANLPTPG
jgi:hypothetical protein